MPLVKRLQKIGGTSLGVVINQEMLQLMNFDPQQEEKKVAISMYGDTLVLRREDAKPLNLQQVAELFGLEPDEASTLPKRMEIESAPKVIQPTLKLLEASPRTVYELSKALHVTKEAAEKLLNRALLKRYAVKDGERYKLNPDLFDV